MVTYQMIGLADENGKAYECKYGTYNKKDGFIFNESVREHTAKEGWRGLINVLFHEDLWKLQPETKKMTLEDLEKELGYRVEIVKSEEDVKKDEEIREMVEDLFGSLGSLFR